MSKSTQGTTASKQASDNGEAQPSYFAPDLIVRGRVSSTTEIFVAGRVEGEVDCASLSVTSGGVVDGSVRSDRVSLESGSALEGEVIAGVLGVKGDARVSARVVCQGTEAREPSQQAMARPNRTRQQLPALGQPVPAE